MSDSKKIKPVNNRTEIPIPLHQGNQQQSSASLNHLNKVDDRSGNNRSKANPMNQLLKNIEKIDSDNKRKQELNRQSKQKQPQRKVTLNLMRLKDKSFKINKNIYNITIGDVTTQQSYIQGLKDQIIMLKNKIQSLEDEQIEKLALKQMSDTQGINYDKNQDFKHIRPICGRLYSRQTSPIFNNDSVSRYKRTLSHANQPRFAASTQMRNFLQAETPQEALLKIQSQETKRSTKVKAHIKEAITIKRVDQESETKIQIKSQVNKNTPISHYRAQKHSKQPIDSINLQVPSAFSSGGSSKNEVWKNQSEAEFQQISILDNQNSSNVQTVRQQEPQELKVVFQDNQLWQITSIQDDFRSKMTKKLQIPKNFTTQQLDPSDPIQIFEEKAVQLYKMFGINLGKCKHKPFVRKFKNGIHYQLRPNKNIVWYYNGSFYFGDWNTDLPIDQQKCGFGFQFVPKQYYYLGYFKNGKRHGKGVIKIIGADQKNFIGYDGEWMNGKPHGFGKHIDDKNNKYVGNFENGEKTGKAVMLNKDGLYFEGQTKNGLKQGFGIEKLANGDVYTGDFVDGKFNGKGLYKWKNGSTFQGEFKDGKREGKGIWKSSNGDQFQGQFSNDLKHGWGKFIWKNGEIYQGEFKNDVRDGQGIFKHPKGKTAKYIWKDGHIDHRVEQNKNELQVVRQSQS